MFRFSINLVFIFLCFIYSSSSIALSKEESLDKLFELSGLVEQITQVPALVQQGLIQSINEQKRQGVEIDEAISSSMSQAAGQSFIAADILNEIRASVEGVFSQGEINRLITWYESDLGKRIAAAENQAAAPEAFNEMLEQKDALLLNQPRVEMALRLDELIGATDMSMQMQDFSNMAIYTAITSMLFPEQPLNLEFFQEQQQQAAPAIRASIQQQIVLSTVYAYRNIDNDSLNQYEAFLKTSTAKKFNHYAIKGLLRGMEKSTSKWAINIANILNSRLSEPKQTGA